MVARVVSPPPLLPYGAPELKQVARAFLARATVTGSGIWILVFLTLIAASGMWRFKDDLQRIPCPPVRPRHMPTIYVPESPPAPTDAAPPRIHPADKGTPIPVPDEKAPALRPDDISGRDFAPDQPIADGRSFGGGEVSPAPPEEIPPNPYEVSITDEPPIAYTRVTPVYPDIATMAGVEGLVVVRALVGKNGHVQRSFVEPKFSIIMLNQAALDAANAWVFKPAFTNGRPVPVWVTMQFRFTLHEEVRTW